MGYVFLEHTADVKFRADGESLEELFVSAADALMEVVRGKIEILDAEKKEVEIEGDDLEELLYNFLEEFLFLLDSEGFLVKKVENLEFFGEKKLKAVLVGDNADRYHFTNDVKAVTYSEMFLKKEGNKFVCQVVLDV